MNRILVIALLLALTVSSRGAEPLPSAAEIKKLTDETLLSFNSAVDSRDFDAFYKSTAKLWQKQTTPDKLKAAFKTFVDQNFDIASVAEKVKPNFEPPPAINSDGLLVVEGSYPIK